MENIINMFIAFNINGWNNLMYTLSTNWCFVLMIICAGIGMALYSKIEIANTAEDKQNIL